MITTASRQIAEIIDSRPTAESLIARFVEQWPGSQAEAEAAADYVRIGRVIEHHGVIAATESEPAQPDAWKVAGELASHTGNHCTCREPAIVDRKFGRLCSHRIAVMMQKRLLAANADALIAIIQAMESEAAEGSADPYAYTAAHHDAAGRIVITLDRYFREHGQEDRKLIRLIGWAREAGPRVDEWAPFEIDNAGLVRVAQATGRTFQAPSKGRSYRYYYAMLATPPAMPDDDARTLRQRDALPYIAAEERRRQLAAEARAIRQMLERAAA